MPGYCKTIKKLLKRKPWYCNLIKNKLERTSGYCNSINQVLKRMSSYCNEINKNRMPWYCNSMDKKFKRITVYHKFVIQMKITINEKPVVIFFFASSGIPGGVLERAQCRSFSTSNLLSSFFFICNRAEKFDSQRYVNNWKQWMGSFFCHFWVGIAHQRPKFYDDFLSNISLAPISVFSSRISSWQSSGTFPTDILNGLYTKSRKNQENIGWIHFPVLLNTAKFHFWQIVEAVSLYHQQQKRMTVPQILQHFLILTFLFQFCRLPMKAFKASTNFMIFVLLPCIWRFN